MDLTSASWTLNYQNTIEASTPFDYLVPVDFTSQTLAIHLYSSADKPTWHTAGYLNQLVLTNLISSSAVWSAYSQRLLIGGNIIFFPNDFSSYQLQFSFPRWFPDAYISIWSKIS